MRGGAGAGHAARVPGQDQRDGLGRKAFVAGLLRDPGGINPDPVAEIGEDRAAAKPVRGKGDQRHRIGAKDLKIGFELEPVLRAHRMEVLHLAMPDHLLKHRRGIAHPVADIGDDPDLPAIGSQKRAHPGHFAGGEPAHFLARQDQVPLGAVQLAVEPVPDLGAFAGDMAGGRAALDVIGMAGRVIGKGGDQVHRMIGPGQPRAAGGAIGEMLQAELKRGRGGLVHPDMQKDRFLGRHGVLRGGQAWSQSAPGMFRARNKFL